MNERAGQALVESIFTLFMSMALIFFLITYALVGISKRIVQWGCFRAARTLLPFENETSPSRIHEARQEALSILRQIPFQKMEPNIQFQGIPRAHRRWGSRDDGEVTVEISQTIYLLGKAYELHEKFSMAR